MTSLVWSISTLAMLALSIVESISVFDSYMYVQNLRRRDCPRTPTDVTSFLIEYVNNTKTAEALFDDSGYNDIDSNRDDDGETGPEVMDDADDSSDQTPEQPYHVEKLSQVSYDIS